MHEQIAEHALQIRQHLIVAVTNNRDALHLAAEISRACGHFFCAGKA
jgi:hypothetical protein